MDAPTGAALPPDDRCIRAVVRPVLPDPLLTGRIWPCSRCARNFDVAHSHAVLYARPGQAVPYAFMVCPACADVLTPVRLELDRERLVAVTRSRRTNDAALRTAVAVADRVDALLALREGPPPTVVRIRAGDVHELATELGASQTEIVDHLRILDVLTGLDTGVEPMEATGAAVARVSGPAGDDA